MDLETTDKPVLLATNRFVAPMRISALCPFRTITFGKGLKSQSPGLASLGGDDGIRTHDPLLAGQVLSQLSYTPKLLGICCFSVFALSRW